MPHPPPKSAMPHQENSKPRLHPGERFVLEGQGGFLVPIRGWRVACFFLTDRRLILYARPRILAEISLGNIHCLLEKTVHFAMKNRTALGVVYRAGSGQAGGRIWLCMNDPGAWKKAIRKGIPENQGLGAGAQRTAAA